MIYLVLIFFSALVLLSYVFDITSRYTRIPGVILLMVLGILLKLLTKYTSLEIPNLQPLLPVIGTLGLILIVLEGSLDLTLDKEKKTIIFKSVVSGILLFLLFAGVFAYYLVAVYQIPLHQAFINVIPLGIISSAVAIPAAANLDQNDKEFVTYESSVSDVLGILVFDFIFINTMEKSKGMAGFFGDIIFTLILSVIFSAGLTFLIQKIRHHVKYVIIMTFIVLVFASAKLVHLPSLLVVLIFGLMMNNMHLFKFEKVKEFLDFEGFREELISFKHITGELTFLVRSFFFIMFGYYTNLSDLLNLTNLGISVLITISIFALRALFFKFILRQSFNPLLFYAPRGLITILLFLNVPEAIRLPFMNEGTVSQIIFLSILVIIVGNIIGKRRQAKVPEFEIVNTKEQDDSELEPDNDEEQSVANL